MGNEIMFAELTRMGSAVQQFWAAAATAPLQAVVPNTVIIGVVAFTLVVLVLVCVILLAKKAFVPSGNVKLVINDSKELSIPCGGKLLSRPCRPGYFVSACGAAARAQCKVKVLAGGGDIRNRTHAHQQSRRQGRRPPELSGWRSSRT